MLSSIVESFIKTHAGKYMKNFSSEKLVVGLNTVKLRDLEVSTEHLWKFKMPFRPVRAFIGEISIDLSFMLGGKLEISVKDVVFIFEKEQYDEVLNPQVILDSLQALISVVYFTMEYPFNLSADTNAPSSMIDFESIHRIVDRLSLNIENVHFRVEEMYSGLALSSSGDMMCLGIQIGKLQIRSATSKEILQEPERFLSSQKFPISINKIVILEDFLVYCKWDNSLLESEFGEITRELVRSTMVQAGSEGILLQPTGGRITIAAAYQKGSLLLRPFKIHCEWQEISVHITNEQILFLIHLLNFFREYPSRLQSLSQVILCDPCPWAVDRSLWVAHSPSYRARLRWSILRKHIKSDWWKRTNVFKEGNIRWRTWFEIWVHTARYVALREILMYHVGYEAFYDENSQMYNYALRENLKLYYSTARNKSLEASDQCVGIGGIERSYTLLAEQYLRSQLLGAGHTLVLDSEQDRDILKALYALQLDYDSFLPYRIAAFARRRAEEKYMRSLSRARGRSSSNNTKNNASASLKTTTAAAAAAGEANSSSASVLLVNTGPPLVIKLPSTVSKQHHSSMSNNNSSNSSSNNANAYNTKKEEEKTSQQQKQQQQLVYLFFAVLDVSNLSPSFASSLVQCTVHSRLTWASESSQSGNNSSNTSNVMVLGESKLLSNRVPKVAYEAATKSNGASPPTTYVQNRHIFTLPLTELAEAQVDYEQELNTASSSTTSSWLEKVCADRLVTVEVVDRSMMTYSLGTCVFPLSAMHSQLMSTLSSTAVVASTAVFSTGSQLSTESRKTADEVIDTSISLGNRTNSLSSSSSSTAASAVNNNTAVSSPAVRIVTRVCRGNWLQLQEELRQFQEDVDAKLLERKPILERAILNGAGKSTNNLNDDDDDDELFILDPALLTVQELTISAHVPQMNLLLSGVYAMPVELRSTILTDRGVDLPRTQYLPFLSLSIRQLKGQIQAANNPIVVSTDCSFDSLMIQDTRPTNNNMEHNNGPSPLTSQYSHHQHHVSHPPANNSSSGNTSNSSSNTHYNNYNHSDHSSKFHLTLPRCTFHTDIYQTSTLPRLLDGHWDASCFEVSSRFTFGSQTNSFGHVLVPPLFEMFLPRPIIQSTDAFDVTSDNNIIGVSTATSTNATASTGATASVASGKMNPQNQSVKSLVWCSRRPLAHIFHDLAEWSQVLNNCSQSYSSSSSKNPPSHSSKATAAVQEDGNEDGGESITVSVGVNHNSHANTKINVVDEIATAGASAAAVGKHSMKSTEYKLKFGDAYELYPLHLNSLRSVQSWLTFRDYNNGGHNDTVGKSRNTTSSSLLTLPTQKFHVAASTAGRTMDCALVLTPSPIFLPSSQTPTPYNLTPSTSAVTMMTHPSSSSSSIDVGVHSGDDDKLSHHSRSPPLSLLPTSQQQAGGSAVSGSSHASTHNRLGMLTGEAVSPAVNTLGVLENASVTPGQKIIRNSTHTSSSAAATAAVSATTSNNTAWLGWLSPTTAATLSSTAVVSSSSTTVMNQSSEGSSDMTFSKDEKQTLLQKIARLERENADLRLQLSKK